MFIWCLQTSKLIFISVPSKQSKSPALAGYLVPTKTFVFRQWKSYCKRLFYKSPLPPFLHHNWRSHTNIFGMGPKHPTKIKRNQRNKKLSLRMHDMDYMNYMWMWKLLWQCKWSHGSRKPWSPQLVKAFTNLPLLLVLVLMYITPQSDWDDINHAHFQHEAAQKAMAKHYSTKIQSLDIRLSL